MRELCCEGIACRILSKDAKAEHFAAIREGVCLCRAALDQLRDVPGGNGFELPPERLVGRVAPRIPGRRFRGIGAGRGGV